MIKVTIDTWKIREIAKTSPEHFEFLRAASKPELPPLEKYIANEVWNDFTGLVNNIEDLPDFILEKASFEVLRPMKLLREAGMRVTSNNVGEIFASAQVHLPGNELLKLSKVEVREDCCTNQLQTDLDEGWRIIAVCPQPSRRPDYILGRY